MTLTTFWLVMLLVSVFTKVEAAEREKVRVLTKGKKTDSTLISLDGREAFNKLHSILHC